MTGSLSSKYLVTTPIREAGYPGVKGRQHPMMTYMSSKQVPEADYYIALDWINDIPKPNPHIFEHVHDYDEIILFWGGDWKRPQVLGAEIEFFMGGQPVTFNTTTGIFIPAGVPHGPVTWKKFHFPHMQMVFMLGTGDLKAGSEKSGISEQKNDKPEKTDDIDYEKHRVCP